MAQSIDKIQVEVEATAKGASQVVSNLADQLKTLQSALNGIDTTKLNKATKSANAIKVDTTSMKKAEEEVQDSVNKIKVSLAKLNTLKNAALSGDSSSLTSFSRRVISIQGEIDGLRERMSQIGTSVPTTAFTQLDSQIEQTKTKLEELKAKEESMGGTAVDLGDMVKVQDDIKNTETELDGLIAKQQELINSGQAFVDPLASVRDSVDSVQQSLTDAKSEVDAFSNAKPTLDVSEMSSGLSDVADKAKDAASQLWSMTKSGIKSGFSGLKSSLSKIKDTLTSIGTKASNTASTGFSKILKYGFGIRSLYVLFRRLRTAVKDSFTELQNSGAYYETTKANVEALKNSLTTLKYQFGAAFEPIFNTVAPALQTLINYLVAVMNTISAFIAKLTGKSTYSKAVVATAEIADNTGSAAGSAAELNKQLQGFDELNNLDLDSGSSGGSGGGSSSDASSVQYVEESVESALGDFANDLIDMIQDGNWEGVGSAISSKITDALNGINWTTIKEKASSFGTNLASFFNGFITTDLFSSIGTTLAESINTAATFLNSFGTTFNWDNLGESIGTGINSFFEDGDFELWGDTVHTWVGGILDAGISLLDTTDFELIGEKLGDFFTALKVDDLVDKVETLCSKIITAMGKVITGFKNNTDEKTKLVTAIGGLLGVLAITKSVPLTLTLAAVIGGIDLGGKLYEVLSGNKVEQSFLEELTDICDGLFGEDKIDFNIASAIKFVWDDLTGKNSGDNSGITGFSRAGFTTAVTTLLNPYLSGALIWIDLGEYIQFKWSDLTSSLSEMWTKLKTAISQFWNGGTYSEFGKGANGMTSEVAEKMTYSSGFKQELQEYGGFIVDGLKEGIELSLKTNPFTAPVVKIYELIKEAIENKFQIGSPAKAMYDFGKYIFLGIIEGFIQEMNNYGWDDLAEDLKNLFTGTTTTKTGNTAQGNFNRNSDKVHGGKNGNTVTYKINTETQINGSKKSKTEINEYATAYDDLFKNASQSASATYSAETGGQLKTIDDVTDWKTKFHNLYQQWMGRDAQFTSSEDGIANGKISGWIVKLGELAKEWLGKSTSATFSTKESGLSSFYTEKTGYLARLQNLNTAWEGKGQNRTATFTTNLGGNLSSASDLNTAATAISTLNNSFTGNKSASYSVSLSGASANDMANYAGGVAALDSSFSSASSKDLDYNVKLSGNYSGVEELVNTIVSKISSKLSKYQLKFTTGALGGIIANGTKYNIPQYAGGTLDAGSVFVAGEAGPEVMGHINGRTEILNRSQIASIMNNSFVSAMAQFGNRMLTSPETVAYRTGSYQTYSGSDSNGNNMYAAEQNELLRQQNELLMQILEKPTGISSRDIFNATRSEASSYYNRTGNSPFI